jgi:hypothetical protein
MFLVVLHIHCVCGLVYPHRMCSILTWGKLCVGIFYVYIVWITLVSSGPPSPTVYIWLYVFDMELCIYTYFPVVVVVLFFCRGTGCIP